VAGAHLRVGGDDLSPASRVPFASVSLVKFLVGVLVVWTPPDKEFFLGDMGTCLTKKSWGSSSR
jgi:hypothetical protein